jgi:HEAT repeat protein
MQAFARNAVHTLAMGALAMTCFLADAQTSVPSLIARLQSPDPAVRDLAARQLGEVHSDLAVKPLIAALDDNNIHVAEDAAEALGELRAVAAVQPLIDSLQHSYCDGIMQHNHKAAVALSAIGMPAVPAMIAALGHARYLYGGDISFELKPAFDGIPSPEIVPALAALLKQSDPEARMYALELLAAHPGSTAVDAALPLLDDPDEDVRDRVMPVLGANLDDPRAVPALRRIVETPLNNAQRADTPNVLAVRQLNRLHDPALIPVFIEAMQYTDSAIAEPSGLKEVIAFGPVSISPLIATLQDRSRPMSVRGGAAMALGQFDDPRVVPLLLTAAKDSSKAVRRGVVQGRIVKTNPAFTDVLLDMLGHDRSALVRQFTVQALETHDDPRINPALVAALKDGEPTVRLFAARALVHRHDIDALSALIDYMQGPTATDHQGGAQALGELGDGRAIQPLIRMLAWTDPGDCHVVSEALAKLGSPGGFPGLRQVLTQPGSSHCGEAWGLLAHDPSSVKYLTAHLDEGRMDHGNPPAYEVLDGSRGSAAVEPAIAALSSPNPTVRAGAAKVLSANQKPGAVDPRAIEPLLHALDDPDEEVRRSAAIALGNVDDVRKIEPFSRALRSSDFAMREYAAAGLGQVHDPRAVAALIEALDDPDFNTRRGLIGALRYNTYAPVLPALLEALRSFNPVVRAGAVEALRYRTEPAVSKALVSMQSDPHPGVRKAARDALSGCPIPLPQD